MNFFIINKSEQYEVVIYLLLISYLAPEDKKFKF